MLRLVSFCFAFLATAIVSAQPGQYRFSRIDVNKGLSHNQVKTFFKDSHGFMWVGTVSGLNRFDGYTVKVFRNDPRDSTSLVNDDINRMFEDPDGRIWISTWSGLDVFDPFTETFRYNPEPMLQRFGLPDRNITDIQRDRQGNYVFVHQSRGLYFHHAQQKKTYNLNFVDVNIYTIASNAVSAIQQGANDKWWILHRNGIIEAFDPATLKVVSRDSALFNEFGGRPNDYRFIIDSEDNLWIYLADSDQGLFHYVTGERILRRYHSASSGVRLNSDLVRGVVQDNEKLIWVATDHGGINVIDTRNNKVSYILNSPQNEHSLSQNSINALYKDREGIIWAGTFKRGVNYYHENIMRFPLYRHLADDPSSIPFDDINAFAEDRAGNLWIGTNGGGLIYFDRKRNTFRQYLNDPGNPNSVSSNVIVSLHHDSRDRLWIGTYFGGLCRLEGGRFYRMRHTPGDTTTISDNSIWEILEDIDGRIYVGTLAGGLDVLDANGKKIRNYSTTRPGTIGSNYVPALFEDREGDIWIGTGYGLGRLNRSSGKIDYYLSQPGDTTSMSSNSVLSIHEDAQGRMWIGTYGGLNYFDRKTGQFTSYTTLDGLPHNSVLTIVEDSRGNLWMSTPNGVSSARITVNERSEPRLRFFNYDQLDGLQARQFNENGAMVTSRGEIVFGGPNGFNIFEPAQIAENRILPRIVITGLEILNHPVRPNVAYDGRVILDKSVSFTDEIELRYKDNVFSIEFAVLSFHHPEKSQYRYKLEGFDANWIPTNSAQRKVTYTNLDPGSYTFRVMASNNDGVWNKEGISLRITVLPPFWRTRYAVAAYVLFILGALFVTRKLIQQRERMKFAIEQERSEAQRMHELDMMKIRFFTNVSHEFRTPLTLILTPMERILKKPDEPVPPGQFELIYRNARRLLNLVNQLLDFRKLEVQEVKFNPSEGDIVHFVRETVFSFSDLSEKKSIPLHFHSSVAKLEAIFDQDKLEKILFNLLSNAFKFTPEGGEVSVALDVNGAKELRIVVEDTGIGIPADKIDRIFERFFQHELPRTMVNQGSGIGLSITREFVKAHDGTIRVESEPAKGSRFIVTLPLREVAAPATAEPAPAALETVQADRQLPSLLLVEDNEDFRFYLKDNLRMHYHIVEAQNGQEGWDKVLSVLPDLVVSDIMMPGMNGIELCRRIKNDRRVSHTPVILLTARTAEEQKLEGFDSGAEDYITKPFNFEILQSRIRNLIQKREHLHKEFRRQIDVRATDIQVTSLDEKLIEKAISIVEAKLGDPDFSVEELARELAMSRVHLYKKLQALTGKSPIEFIRNLRLQHAAQLLEKSQLTVSEIAYKVGFNNPKYFARYFRDEYKVLPSAYSASRRKTT